MYTRDRLRMHAMAKDLLVEAEKVFFYKLPVRADTNYKQK